MTKVRVASRKPTPPASALADLEELFERYKVLNRQTEEARMTLRYSRAEVHQKLITDTPKIRVDDLRVDIDLFPGIVELDKAYVDAKLERTACSLDIKKELIKLGLDSAYGLNTVLEND